MDGRNHPRHPFPPLVILIEDEDLITNPQGLVSFVPSFALNETWEILFHPPSPELVDDVLSLLPSASGQTVESLDTIWRSVRMKAANEEMVWGQRLRLAGVGLHVQGRIS